MDNSNTTSEKEEESPITNSMRIGLISAIFNVIGDALALISVLEAFDETIAADIQDKKDKKELDEKLQDMQSQIDMLTDEINRLNNRNND